MGTLINRKDPFCPDEIPLNVVFHQGLHCLLKNRLSEKNAIFFGKYNLTRDP